MHDVRLAIRNLLARPSFSIVAILTLALGIGANASVFTVLNAVLLSPLPYQQPDRIVIINETSPQLPNASVTRYNYDDWRERAHRRLLLSGLEEVHAAAVGRPARTFPARAPWLRLDRIYVRNVRHRPVKVSARDWRMLSDHLPLAAELSMSGIRP